MIIDNPKSLRVLLDRLIPDKFKGTTFEKIVDNMLKNLSDQHQYIDHFTNRFDIAKIENDHNDEELKTYTNQYLNILSRIIDIEYPTLVKNGKFISSKDFWSFYTTSELESINTWASSLTYKKGSVVKYNNNIFQCLNNNTSGTSTAPSTSKVDTQYWKFYSHHPIPNLS